MTDDLEKVVFASINPTSPDKTKATKLLQEFRESPGAWKTCLQKCFQTPSVQVQFYCYSVILEAILHKFTSLSPQDRQQLRQGLLHLLKNVKPNTSTPVRGKIAQLLVHLLKREYLETWSSFFQDVMNDVIHAPSPEEKASRCDLFMRIMTTIDQEIVAFDYPRSAGEREVNQEIKNKMREEAIPAIVNL